MEPLETPSNIPIPCFFISFSSSTLHSISYCFAIFLASAAISLGFKNAVEEIRQSNEGLKASGRGFDKLAKVAQELQLHQEGINALNKSDLETLESRARTEKTL